ncbi:FecR family protein [Larkinella soli]|uniref:FecR family protein n=1 Tax=Larkinella soli TaxID=1770527 RepID=UPI000FFC794B|nr:FecR family protein [Larkinella soli]
MKEYRNYEVEDFIQEASFRDWVKHPGGPSAPFWQEWVRQNPDRADAVRQARAFLEEINRRFTSSIDSSEVQHDIAVLVQAALRQEAARPEKTGSDPLFSGLRQLMWVAASVLLLGAAGFWWMRNRPGEKPTGPTARKQQKVEKINHTDRPMTVLLEDGSVVTLESHSRLQFPDRFEADRRKVFLEGEAFFEIAENQRRPFVVYSRELVTQVLGTNFRVEVRKEDETARVTVRTGKVAVESRHGGYGTPESERHHLVLTANQQAVFYRDENRMAKLDLKQTEPGRNRLNRDQVFDNTAVPLVLKSLKRQYGVELVFNEADLEHCYINTSFRDENLRERLSAICQAIGATYEIDQSQVVIKSNGCNP